MNEIFLLKLGEIVLKGTNKRQFENRLRQNIRRRMKDFGNFDVTNKIEIEVGFTEIGEY